MKIFRAGLVLACVFFASSRANAGDATVAEALFREGKALMDAGDLEHACPKLRESYVQDPATGTLLALAICFERRGKLASAWATYSQVASRARTEGRSDREQAAREHVSAIEPKLSRLTVIVPAELSALPGFAVKRDGQPMTEALWGSPLPADPGEHVIEVSAEGKKPWQARVTLGPESDAQSVVVPPLEPAEAQAPPIAGRSQAAPSSPGTAATEGTPHASRALPLRPIGLVVGGAGVVALGVGAAFVVKAAHANADSKANGHCDTTGCDAVGKQLRNDAFSDAGVATALVIAGGVLTAGGVTLYLIGNKQEPRAPSVSLVPSAELDGGGLWLYGAF